MSMSRWARRGLMTGVGAVGALAFGISSASAHHCFVPMYSLSGPVSENWAVFSAEDGAAFIFGYEAECDAAVAAGYAALEEADLPVGIKIFEHMTIGDPKHTGRTNPNGDDGRGVEYLEQSSLADAMITTWAETAMATDCS